MFIGTADFTAVAFVALFSFIILAFAEYYICTKAKTDSAKKLLFFLPFLILTGALVFYGTSDGFFADLQKFIALFIVGYGFLCLFAIACGYGIYMAETAKKEKQQLPPDCPMGKNIPQD